MCQFSFQERKNKKMIDHFTTQTICSHENHTNCKAQMMMKQLTCIYSAMSLFPITKHVHVVPSWNLCCHFLRHDTKFNIIPLGVSLQRYERADRRSVRGSGTGIQSPFIRLKFYETWGCPRAYRTNLEMPCYPGLLGDDASNVVYSG